VPTLRDLVARGASSDGVESVFPTVTYPAHTTIASGVRPLRHGIHANRAFDPLDKNQDAWRWYAEDVKVPRLWDVARSAGYRTAVLDWPVTVGTLATFHVPEFWRAKVPEDVKLIRALSTPGLLESVSAAYPTFAAGFRPQDVADEAGMDLAEHLVTSVRPHLLFLHIWQVDAAQHRFGLWSAEALSAIENADRQLGRLVAAVRRANLEQETLLVVVSDHGFADVSRCVNPNALLARAGLLTLDERGRVTAWRAAALANGGTAYVYVNDPTDAEARTVAERLFTAEIARPGSGIARLLPPAEIEALGGDPTAAFVLEAELGTYLDRGTSDCVVSADYKATHGYDPRRPEMRASLLLVGPGVPTQRLEGARLIDVAPTGAAFLGLELTSAEGRALVTPAAAPRR
jgi:predicted AlkP superfamily pyrophosphatase or phosphodiesterase